MKNNLTECVGTFWKKEGSYPCAWEPEFHCKTHGQVFCRQHVYTVSATNFDRRIVRNKQPLCHSGFKSEYENPLDGGCNVEEINKRKAKSPA